MAYSQIRTHSRTKKGLFLSTPVSLLITTILKCGPVLHKNEAFQNTSTFWNFHFNVLIMDPRISHVQAWANLKYSSRKNIITKIHTYFQALRLGIAQIIVFWAITPCKLINFFRVLYEHATYIFRVTDFKFRWILNWERKCVVYIGVLQWLWPIIITERDERTDLVPTQRGMESAVSSLGLKTTVKIEAACSSELWEKTCHPTRCNPRRLSFGRKLIPIS